jgi:hypothetical protein
MNQESDTESPFSARTASVLIAVATLAFGAIFVLAGWSPELRDRNLAGDHPYSTSALGYGGLVKFLQTLGYPVRVTRNERELESSPDSLLIVTIPERSSSSILNDTNISRGALVVLPKWTGLTDPVNPRRQFDTQFVSARYLNNMLERIDGDAEIVRADPGSPVTSEFGNFSLLPDTQLQLIKSDNLETIAGTRQGALLAYDPVRGLFLLSDPDVLNTFGLASAENAAFAIAMMNHLREGESRPILLDATLHGFTISRNLLQMIFSIPFLGATLVAVSSALLLGWAAIVRFGPTAPPERAIALGKQALADNSAGLVRMARRESKMAPAYLAVMRRRLAQELGVSRKISDSELSGFLDRLAGEAGTRRTFTQIEISLSDTGLGREDLVNRARELFDLRCEIIRRRFNERR